MGGQESNAGSFDRPIQVDAANDVAELCDRIRHSLQSNHVHCPEADRTGLTERLLEREPQLWKILGEGFDHIIVTPEPATMSLLAVGALAILRRKRR